MYLLKFRKIFVFLRKFWILKLGKFYIKLLLGSWKRQIRLVVEDITSSLNSCHVWMRRRMYRIHRTYCKWCTRSKSHSGRTVCGCPNSLLRILHSAAMCTTVVPSNTSQCSFVHNYLKRNRLVGTNPSTVQPCVLFLNRTPGRRKLTIKEILALQNTSPCSFVYNSLKKKKLVHPNRLRCSHVYNFWKALLTVII